MEVQKDLADWKRKRENVSNKLLITENDPK